MGSRICGGEEFAFFLWDEGIAAVRAAKFEGGEAVFCGLEGGGADLAQEQVRRVTKKREYRSRFLELVAK